jgi:UDP-glucose 4-epimerase
MSTLLITGASGNIGTALLRRLQAERSDLDVIAVARRIPPAQEPYDRARWHSVDLTDPAATDKLTDLMTGVAAVVHLVWGFQPTRDPEYLRQLGVDGTARVLAAADRAGVAHLIHMSSVGTYAPRRDTEPVAEDYPHTGMPTSTYSRHKAAAEALLDDFEHSHPDVMTITRLRPGLVMQRDAGAGLSRYGLPAYLPARLLPYVPILPLAREFAAPVVHADDVADAIVRLVQRPHGGAFNLAAEAPLTRADVADVLHARPVHVPAPMLRTIVAGSWRLHLQPLSPGWIDMAFAAPVLDSTRARTELGWRPRTSARAAFADAVSGIAANAGTRSAPLRPRDAVGRIRDLLGAGPVSSRKEP